MAPVIRSRYEQYKRDTQQFTTWLAQTAISLGCPLSQFDQEVGDDVEIIVRSAASKRNAKKKARAKEKVRLARQGREGDKEKCDSTSHVDRTGASKLPQAEAGRNQRNGRNGSSPSLDNTQAEESRGLAGVSAEEQPDNGRKQSPSTAERSGQQISSSGSSGRYTLKLSLYIEVAQYILDQGASIPTDVIRILKRCISLRQTVSRQFVATSGAHPSNDSHRYFFDILVTIRGIFECANAASDPSSPILTHNQFGGLCIEESRDDADAVPDIDLPRVASQIPDTSFEPQMVIMEAISAIVMFLGDLYDTKTYLGNLWIDYNAGLVDLITAAVTTNTALDILQKPHDELMKRVMPIFEHDFEQMVYFTFSILCGPEYGLSKGIPEVDLIDEGDRKLEQIYDLLMLPLVQIFEGLADSLTARRIPYPQLGRYGKYDPNAPFHRLGSQARWKQYRILLPELLSDIDFFLAHSGAVAITGSPLGSDCITRLLDRFIHTKKILFHLTFAMRVFMDINFALGPAASRGRQYLHNTAGRMIGCLASRPSLRGPVLPDTPESENEKLVDQFIALATWCADLDLRRNTILPEFSFSDWLVFDRHPLLCGLLVFRLQIVYQDIGLGLANDWGSIQYAAHLYEACRQSGYTPRDGELPTWPDMELVLELHGKELAFGGKLPTTLDESERAFQRVAGFSTDVIKAKLRAFTGAIPHHRKVKKPQLWSRTGPM